MKKPSDALKVNNDADFENEVQLYELAYTLVGDYGMSIEDAGELAEAMIGLQLMYSLKNELEDIYNGGLDDER